MIAPVATSGAKTSAKPRKTLGRRLLRAAAVAFVMAYVFYVAALNVFLSTSLFDRIVNQDPITIEIHFTRGWTLLPGTIHAENLSIRSSDSNVEWMLRIDAVEFDVSFLSLARQRFDVTRARGRGISMRARQKLALPPAGIEDFANLPPIAGYPAYSMRPSGPPSLERWFDEHYALWTVQLSDVVADDVREVWIDDGRFEGSARIAGGFFLKPIREVVVGPAHVEARPGSRVTLGASTPLVTELAGTADLFIDRFDPRALVDDDIFRFITGKTDFRARFADPASLPFALPVYVSSAIEARQLRLDIERGVFRPGTRIELDAALATVAKNDVIGRGPFNFTAEVSSKPGEADELRASLVIPDVSVMAADATEIVRGRSIVITADSRALDLAKKPLADAHVAIDLAEARVADATVLALYLPRITGLRVLGGSAFARARVDVYRAEERAYGNVGLVANAIDLQSGRSRIRGSLDGRVEVGSYRFGADAAENVSVTATVTKAELQTGIEKMQPRFGVGELRLAARTPRLELGAPLRNVDATLSTPNATVSNVELPSPWVPQGNAEIVRGRCELAVDAHVTTENGVGRGTVTARSKNLELDLGDMVARAALDARVNAHDVRVDAKRMALDGAHVKLAKLTLQRKDKPDALVSIDSVIAKVRSPRFSVANPLDRVDLDLELSDGRVADPAALDAFLPAGSSYGIAAEHGSFDLRARLAIEDGIARGRAQAKARDMGFHGKEVSLRGDTEIEAALNRWDIAEKKVDIGPSRIALENVHGRVGGREDAPGELTAKRVELTASATDLSISTPSLRGIDAKLVLDDVILPDARQLQFLVPSRDGLRFVSGSARAFGAVALSSSARAASGTIEIDIARGAVGINDTELAGDFVMRARFRDFDPETSTIDLSGTTVSMRDVRVRGAAAETAQWSGAVTLEKTSLRLDGRPSETPRLDGILHIEADDARPLLGVLLRDSLPKLVVGLVKMPHLTGYARVHVSPNLVLLSDVSASGGDVAVRGSYGLYGEDRRGAFVVEKGPFSVGIGLEKDGASPRFFNLGAWLGAQERASRAKAAEALNATPDGKQKKATPKAADARGGERLK